MNHPIDERTLSETWEALVCDKKMKEYGLQEFDRLLKSQYENVIQVYAKTTTDRNSMIIVMDRAINGDLKAFYKAMIEKHNKDRKKDSRWSPYFNTIGGKYGIVSILPWTVISAADRMLLVF
jgi:hypothetical protein